MSVVTPAAPVLGTSAVSYQYLEKLIKQLAPDEDAEWDATYSFLKPFFDALGGIDTWKAVEAKPAVMLYHYNKINVFRQELREAADQYINAFPWLHHPHIDWVVANALMYAEVVATVHTWSASYLKGGGLDFGLAALSMGWSLLKLGVVAGMIIVALVFDVTWLAWLVGGLFVWSQVAKGLLAKKRGKVLGAMLNTYDAAKTSTLSWSNLWDQMTAARDLGAYWDPELYRLVEMRKDRL
jgi:hypothetical protein